MIFRLATPADLPQVQAMFTQITAKLNAAHGEIWNDFYPNELFPQDVENSCLFVLEGEGELLSAFALCENTEGDQAVEWGAAQKPLYFCRFGVHVDHRKEGLGSLMVQHALELAKARGYDALRLLVVDRNTSAIAFYEKNGFAKVPGYFDEYIHEALTLRQYGMEGKVQ